MQNLFNIQGKIQYVENSFRQKLEKLHRKKVDYAVKIFENLCSKKSQFSTK